MSRTWTEEADWYDVMNPWGPSDDFYLGLVMTAGAVLDVGCGTGTLLDRARQAGHTGRLTGIDPAPAMLAYARGHPDIEWLESTAAGLTFDREFDLAVMASHAFQVFASDEELIASLAAIHAALAPGGRFAFETRNPAVRDWEQWGSADPWIVQNPDGLEVAVTYDILDVTDGVVRLTETLTCDSWPKPLVGLGTLRFTDAPTLATFLDRAGFVIEDQFGDWQRAPLTPTSAEIITIARRPS